MRGMGSKREREREWERKFRLIAARRARSSFSFEGSVPLFLHHCKLNRFGCDSFLIYIFRSPREWMLTRRLILIHMYFPGSHLTREFDAWIITFLNYWLPVRVGHEGSFSFYSIQSEFLSDFRSRHWWYLEIKWEHNTKCLNDSSDCTSLHAKNDLQKFMVDI